MMDEDESLSFKMNEIRVINGFVKNFLPNYGSSIENLILYGSLTINDNTARKIFDSCPNLKHLNIGMTKLTPKAFIHFRWVNSLESLILEGCELMDDNLFTHLISSLISSNSEINTIEDKQECLLENICYQTNNLNRFSLCKQCSYLYSTNLKKLKLKILNLSGCYRFTDYGLNLLITNGITECLKYIDLSGCIGINSDCISLLVFSSTNLREENIYICDNLQSSLLSTANCCRNLENNSGRYCCRGRN